MLQDEDDRAQPVCRTGQCRHTCCETHPHQRTHWHANLPVLRPLEDAVLAEIAAAQMVAAGDVTLAIVETPELRVLREQDRVKYAKLLEHRRLNAAKQRDARKGDS